jgi:sialic acid synthase SpsE
MVAFGLSDHKGLARYVAPSCPMVERHICLPDVDTPDKAFSSTPDEFREYVAAIKGKT